MPVINHRKLSKEFSLIVAFGKRGAGPIEIARRLRMIRLMAR
jgi:hypothetical protein